MFGEIMGLFFSSWYRWSIWHLWILSPWNLHLSFSSTLYFPGYHPTSQTELKKKNSNIYYSSGAVMLIFSLAVPLTFMASLKKLEGEYVLSVQAYIHRIVASFGINPRSDQIWSVAQSCPTLWDPMDCSLPGSSFHRILQTRVLEWVAISFSRGSSQPRDRTPVSGIPGRLFNLWANREAPD